MKYKLINCWTKEGMVAHIKKHFGPEDTRCVGAVGCAYRKGKKSPDSSANACAVGCFLTDEEAYGLGGATWNRAFEILSKKGAKPNTPLDVEGMYALQLCHDWDGHGVAVLPVLLSWIEENVE